MSLLFIYFNICRENITVFFFSFTKIFSLHVLLAIVQKIYIFPYSHSLIQLNKQLFFFFGNFPWKHLFATDLKRSSKFSSLFKFLWSPCFCQQLPHLLHKMYLFLTSILQVSGILIFKSSLVFRCSLPECMLMTRLSFSWQLF